MYYNIPTEISKDITATVNKNAFATSVDVSNRFAELLPTSKLDDSELSNAIVRAEEALYTQYKNGINMVRTIEDQYSKHKVE